MTAELITHLYDEMCEELESAEEYGKLSMMWKPKNAEYARTYHTMANDELRHAGLMHDMATIEMEKLKKEHPDAPFAAEYQRHFGEKFIDKSAKIKQMLMMAQG